MVILVIGVAMPDVRVEAVTTKSGLAPPDPLPAMPQVPLNRFAVVEELRVSPTLYATNEPGFPVATFVPLQDAPDGILITPEEGAPNTIPLLAVPLRDIVQINVPVGALFGDAG